MTLVYQAYGREDIIRQSMFSVLTYLRWNLADKVLIYTDREQHLRNFFSGFEQVEIIAITPDQLLSWRGKIDFVHRVKIEILIDAAKRTKDSLLYLDGDTVFTKNPKDIMMTVNPGQHLMHVMESKLGEAKDPLTKKIANFCRRQNFALKRGLISIPLSTEMWNAGVIGIHESRVNLLDRILELTDAAYTLYQKHVIEQLAVSYFLQSAGKVLPAEAVVHHYWQSKEVWQARIDQFLIQNPTAADGLKALGNFDFSIPPVPVKKNWWQKLFS